jgi:hypothetical protein
MGCSGEEPLRTVHERAIVLNAVLLMCRLLQFGAATRTRITKVTDVACCAALPFESSAYFVELSTRATGSSAYFVELSSHAALGPAELGRAPN